jgi:hypothetical protein
VVETLAAKKIFAGVPATRLWPEARGLDNMLVVAVTETSHKEEMVTYCEALTEAVR